MRKFNGYYNSLSKLAEKIEKTSEKILDLEDSDFGVSSDFAMGKNARKIISEKFKHYSWELDRIITEMDSEFR